MRYKLAERTNQSSWRSAGIVALALILASCGNAETTATTRQRVVPTDKPVAAEVLGATEASGSQTSPQPVLIEQGGCLVGQPLRELPDAETFLARWNAALDSQNKLCHAGDVELETRAWTLESYGPDWVGRMGSQFGLIETDGEIERFHVTLVVDDISEGLDERVFALASVAIGAHIDDTRWNDVGCDWSATWSGNRHHSGSGAGSISIDLC